MLGVEGLPLDQELEVRATTGSQSQSKPAHEVRHSAGIRVKGMNRFRPLLPRRSGGEALSNSFIGGCAFGGIYIWCVIVIAHAAAQAAAPDERRCTTGGQTETSMLGKRVYYQLYHDMLLPAIAGTGLVAIIGHPSTDNLGWWATVFFVLYYSVVFTLVSKDAQKLSLFSFVLNVASVAVFAYVMNSIGALSSGGFVSKPVQIFWGILAIPVMGALSRRADGSRLRIAPTIIGVSGAVAGLVAAYSAWSTAFIAAIMILLFATLLRYVLCIVASDGAENGSAHVCCWCTDGTR